MKASKRYDEAAAKIDTRQGDTRSTRRSASQGMPRGEVRRDGGRSSSGSASIPSTPTRWCAARWCCPTASARPCAWPCSPRARRSARRARPGADIVGAEDLVEKVQGGWLEFDTAIATPDLMGQVGRLGKVLGPRGLMPNPKLGTVTFDVGRAVREAKAGKVEFRVDKAGNVHAPVGKRSFDAEQLARQRDGAHRGDRPGEAGGGEGRSTCAHHGVDDHGARACPIDAAAIANQFKKASLGGRRRTCRRKRRRDGRGAEVAARRRDRPRSWPSTGGLTVRQLAELRKQLKAASAEYKVVKNRLARLAIKASSLGDARRASRRARRPGARRKDPVSGGQGAPGLRPEPTRRCVKVGVVDGQVLAAEGLKALADLPSREALRAQIVGASRAPLATLVGLLQAPQRELVVHPGAQRGAAERPRDVAVGNHETKRRDTEARTTWRRTSNEIAEKLDKLTLLEAAQLIEALQEKWGVSRRRRWRWRRLPARRRGAPAPRGRGEDGVRRRPHGGRREEDPGHQGRPRAHRPRA